MMPGQWSSEKGISLVKKLVRRARRKFNVALKALIALTALREGPPIDPPTERGFGALFAVVIALIAGHAISKGWRPAFVVGLIVAAAAFALAALLAPRILAPLNRLWFSLGILLGTIISPIVLGAIFFLIITPVGVVTRLGGRDVLRLHKRTTSSYWIERNPIGPQPASFKNQY
jgi:hypothetical protein